MNISVIGTGYVGLVTGACLASKGQKVVCADIDATKIDLLNQGVIPLYELGLEGLVTEGMSAGRLSFTTDVAGAVQGSSMVFLAVGTPPSEDGSADTRALFQVADTITGSMRTRTTVVLKRTVPVGTAQKVRAAIAKKTDVPFAVLNNPEFLREGHAVEDFMAPSRVVIGADGDAEDAELLRRLYKDFAPEDRILTLDTRSAEMSKYVSNAFLATKISFINEMANLCDALGADVELVRDVTGLDPRIGSPYLSPGIGYGGSCFPKDVQAILHMSEEARSPTHLLDAVHKVNVAQPGRIVRSMIEFFDGSLLGRRVAMWGLAFKPDTDDIRGAPSLAVINLLLNAGAEVAAFDPSASTRAKSVLNGQIQYASDKYQCLQGADALVLATEWEQFKDPDWAFIRDAMRTPVVFDGRNIYNPASLAAEGFSYFGIGRGGDGRRDAAQTVFETAARG